MKECEICGKETELLLKYDPKGSKWGLLCIQCTECGSTYANEKITKLNLLLKQKIAYYEDIL
jgi:uncharacterized Zn finger protein